MRIAPGSSLFQSRPAPNDFPALVAMADTDPDPRQRYFAAVWLAIRLKEIEEKCGCPSGWTDMAAELLDRRVLADRFEARDRRLV